jgi:hypothetical protein
MNKSEILSSLDVEIQRLQLARELLSGESKGGKRANASKNATNKESGTGTHRKRRHMSIESRAKIAAAQKKRWAALKSRKRK